MTGHSELIGHRPSQVQSRLFTEGVVYQRSVPAPYTPHPSPENLLGSARELADRGDYAGAEQTCLRGLAITPLAPELYFLLAQLAQLSGEFERARELLEKTLYLGPACVAATLELAALCERAENLPRAQSLRRAARQIVRTLPAVMAQWLEP